MKQFSNSRGVALLAVLLLILIMSLLATQLSQVLFKDLRNSKNVEFNSLSNIYIDFLQSHFQDVFGESITQNKSNLNKSTISVINNYGIEFQGFEAKFEVKDFSNCFNINSLFLEREGTLLINKQTLLFFKELLNLNNKIKLPEISMGMTNDYLEALEFKSTYLRIGTGIFGKRTN